MKSYNVYNNKIFHNVVSITFTCFTKISKNSPCCVKKCQFHYMDIFHEMDIYFMEKAIFFFFFCGREKYSKNG